METKIEIEYDSRGSEQSEEDRFETTLADLRVLLMREEATLAIAQRRVDALRSAIEALASVEVDRPKSRSRKASAAAGSISRRRPRKGSLAELIRSQTAEILRKHGKPMTRNEIYQKLVQNGMELKMKQPLKRVSKILWEAHEFESTRSGYWFSDRGGVGNSHEAIVVP